MDFNAANRLTNQPKTQMVPISVFPFAMLCGYMAMIPLGYMEWMPGSLSSLFLYAFIGLTAVYLLVRGRAGLGAHTIWYSIVCLLAAISCLYSSAPEASGAKLVEMLKLLLFSVMFFNVVTTRKRLTVSMVVLSVATSLLFVYVLASGQMEEEERLGGELTGNSNTFASIMMLGAVCSTYFVCFTQKGAKKVLVWLLLILQMYALAMAGGRKFFLLPIALLCGVQMFKIDKTGRRKLLRNLFISIAVVVVVFWAIFKVEFLYEAIGHRMEGLFNSITGQGEVDASTQARQRLVKVGMELWKQSPVFGYGIDSYMTVANMPAYSHNNYVELLCSFGLLGTAFYYTFHIAMMVKLNKRTDLQTERLFWLFLMLLLMVYDFGAVSYFTYPVHFMLLLANCTLQRERLEEPQPEQAK